MVTITNLLLCVLIVTAGILFITVNMNYLPDEDEDNKDEDNP